MAARFLPRFTHTSETLRAVIINPADRRARFASLLKKNIRVGADFYSITKSQALTMVEGDLNELRVREFTLR